MGGILSKLFGLSPTPEENGPGYIPSPFSRMLAIDSKTDYKPVVFGKTYNGPLKILVVCTEERYMTMANGKLFSSGNHPVETLQPLMHLENAGFAFDVATPTGKPAALELWALPKKDTVFLEYFEKYKSKLNNPMSLAALVSSKLKENYAAIFAPGGQGAMLGLPEDENMGKLVAFVKETDRYFLSVCHGPAVLLSAKKTKPHPYEGYKIACFPDAVDKQTPSVGYLPGVQTWYFGEKLIEECGITIVNTGADGTFVADRKLLTGASPKACQELGVTAASKLLEDLVEA